MIQILKKTFSALVIAVSLLFISLSPYSYGTVVDRIRERTVEQAREETYSYNLDMMQASVEEAAKTFDESRTFEVSYTDVDRILQVLGAVSGIEVRATYAVDPFAGYQDIALYNSGDNPNAVRFDLLVEDPIEAMEVFSKMELAVCDYSFTTPNILSVTILTGGDV